jgi:Cellulase (glycosyl hydrolase family 5)
VLAGATATVRAQTGRRLRIAVATLGLAIFALGAQAANAAAATPDLFGVNGQNVFSGPPSQWDAELATMAASGLQVVRRDASWDSIEPQAPNPATGQHTYDWSRQDAQVAAMARHGLRWYPILDYSAPWAAQVPGDPFSPPARTSDYVAWAQALAQRYGAGGAFWQAHPELTAMPVTTYEVWNEENTKQFWHPQANAPEAYADLYLATRAALKQVDPSARVVVGGLALANTDVTDESQFVQRMYAHRPDLRGNVDAVGFHPYAPDVSGVETKLSQFRQTLDSVGAAGVPIEITEIGWPTPQYSEAVRATNLQQLALDLPRSDCDVERFIPHTWVEPTSASGSFGIMAADGTTPLPSGAAYLNAVRQMRGLAPGAPTGTLHICYPGNTSTVTPSGVTRPRGPQLQLRVIRDARHKSRVTVVARCPHGCRLQVDLVKPSRPAGKATVRLDHRSTRFTSKRQRLRLHVSRRTRTKAGRVRVTVLAIDRAGLRTSRTRTIRVR